MPFKPNALHKGDCDLSPMLQQLHDLFSAMDQAYSRAAGHYQFQCDGCTDNCCLTRFYHHTYLEYYYLGRGFEKLDFRKKNRILLKAQEVCREFAKADNREMPVKLMCPLNKDSRCILYPYRPMICRMHGIPHELHGPGQKVTRSPGCGTFYERCSDKGYTKFDRTPFYIEMVKLENEFKQATGLDGRIKMTVAEMIVSLSQKKKD